MHYVEAFRSVGSPTRARVEEFLFSFFLCTTLGETFVALCGSRTGESSSIILNLKFILISGTFLILAGSRLESRE